MASSATACAGQNPQSHPYPWFLFFFHSTEIVFNQDCSDLYLAKALVVSSMFVSYLISHQHFTVASITSCDLLVVHSHFLYAFGSLSLLTHSLKIWNVPQVIFSNFLVSHVICMLMRLKFLFLVLTFFPPWALHSRNSMPLLGYLMGHLKGSMNKGGLWITLPVGDFFLYLPQVFTISVSDIISHHLYRLEPLESSSLISFFPPHLILSLVTSTFIM